MASRYGGYITLRGADNRETRALFDLGEFDDIDGQGDEFLAARNALDAIVAEYADVTDAVIVQSGVVETPAPVGGNGAGDLFEKALINVWSVNENDDLDVESKSQIYIHAPSIGIFQTATGPGRNRVDTADADLQAYIAALAANAYISDGETIQTSSGVAGMDSGRRIVRKFKVQG